jgi:hypothetical protein
MDQSGYPLGTTHGIRAGIGVFGRDDTFLCELLGERLIISPSLLKEMPGD